MRQAAQSGVLLPGEPTLNFVSGATVADNPSNGTTDVTIVQAGTGLWVTQFDLDFTAQGNQNLGTDGNHTIGGLTWVKFGSADENLPTTPSQIVNGTGLVLNPYSNGATLGQYYGNSPYQVPPILRLQLSGLVPNFETSIPLRAYVTITGNTSGSDNTFGPFLAFDNGSYASHFPNLTSAFIQAGFANSSYAIFTDNWWNSSGHFGGPHLNFGSRAAMAAWQTLAIDMPLGIGGGAVRYFMSQSGSSSGFPALSSFTPLGPVTYNNNGQIPNLDANTAWSLVLGCCNGLAPMAATISRVRLDYKGA